jgi:spermidine/putrescine transport system ATP-binding protein
MQVELKELQHRVGTTFIYVTHDQSEALTMSDRIAVMHDGCIEQIGAGKDVYESPRTRFVATFLGESNLFSGTVAATGPDGTRIDADGLTLVAPPHDDLRPGAAVYICVRPERIRALDAPGAPSQDRRDANVVRARVRGITFKGAVIEYRLVTPSGLPILVHAPSDGSPITTRDAVVTVGWRKDDCVVLNE